VNTLNLGSKVRFWKAWTYSYLNMIKEKIDIGRNLLAVICKCNNLQTEWALHLFASTVDLIKVVNQISVHWWSEPTDPTLIWHLNFNMCTVHVWDKCRFVPELFLADTAHQVCDLQMNLKEKQKTIWGWRDIDSWCHQQLQGLQAYPMHFLRRS